MAHELSIQNGVAEMVSGQGKTPWHKLGTVVQGLMTAADAMEKAHLGWTVKGMPVTVNGKQLPFPNGEEKTDTWQGMCRTDTGDCLGIVKGKYEPIQNKDAFNFFDNIVGHGRAVYDTAGALRGGRQVWLLAKLTEGKFVNKDEHRQWALMMTSHDGSYSMMLQWVFERVVCANTMSIALRGATNQIKIRHTTNWKDKEDEAKRVLGMGTHYFDSIQSALSSLGDKLLTPEQMAEFSRVLVPAKDEKDVPTRTANIRAEINRLFGAGDGNHGCTRWDALNAVTDYVGHGATLRGKQSTRLESALLGSGQELTQRAFEVLTDESQMTQLMERAHKVTIAPAASTTDFARLLGK